MPEQTVFQEAGLWLVGAAGGLVDYLNQMTRGERKWSLVGFIVHLSSACFFGFLAGSLITGFDYSPEVAYSASGLGGFMGTRGADLFMTWIKGRAS